MSQLNSSVSGLSDVEPGLGRIYLKGDAGDDHFSEEDNAVKTPMECECEADATKWLQSCASPDRSAADDGRMEMEPSIGAWHTFEDASICDSQLSDHDGEVVASPTSHATKPEGGEGLTAEGGDADDDEGGDGMDVEAGSVDGSQRHTLSKGADDDDRGGGGGGAEVAGYDKGDQEESSGQDDAPSQPPEPATDLHGDESGIKGSRRGRRRRRTGACSGDAEISGAGRSGDDGARNRKAGMDAAGDGGNNVLRSSCSSARVDGDGEVHNDQVLIAVHAGHEDTPSSSSLSAAAADQEDGTVDEEDAGNAHARQEEREEEEGQEEERGGKRGKRRSSGDEACGISEDESELPPERNELVSPFTMPTDYESG